MFSSRHCPRSDFSPTKPDPHVLTVTWDLLLAFLPPSVKGRQRRAHLASPCSKGFVHCSFCPKHSVIGVGTSSITTIQVSTKENLKKGSNYSGLGQLSPASCSFSHPEPKTCTVALFHKAHHKPSVLCYKTSESQPPGPAQSQGKEKGVGFELSQKDSWLRNFSQEARLLLFPPSAPNTSPRLRIRFQKRAQLS